MMLVAEIIETFSNYYQLVITNFDNSRISQCQKIFFWNILFHSEGWSWRSMSPRWSSNRVMMLAASWATAEEKVSRRSSCMSDTPRKNNWNLVTCRLQFAITYCYDILDFFLFLFQLPMAMPDTKRGMLIRNLTYGAPTMWTAKAKILEEAETCQKFNFDDFGKNWNFGKNLDFWRNW